MADNDSTPQRTFWDNGSLVKRCKDCGELKPLEEFYLFKKARRQPARAVDCRLCHNARVQAYRKRHPENARLSKRRSHLKGKFGLSAEEHARMLEKQGSVCAICGKRETNVGQKGRLKSLCVDHDHRGGAVRGLLCNACNIMIGKAGDDPAVLRAAAAYLDSHQRRNGVS